MRSLGVGVSTVVVVFLFYGYRDVSPRFLEDLLGGQRLILAAHAALIVGTARVWSRIPLIRLAPVVLVAGIAAVIGHHLAPRHLVQRYEPAAQTLAACSPDTVIYNQYPSRVALSTDAKSFHMMTEEPTRLRADVAVFALRQLTNRFDTANSFKVPSWLLSRTAQCQRHGEIYIFDLAGRCPRTGEDCVLSAGR